MENSSKINEYNLNLKEDVYSTDTISQFKNTLGKVELLTDEEFKELYDRYKKGDKEARDEILKHNYKLVLSIASAYTKWGYNITLEDAFQQGIVLLIKALEKYNINQSAKFSTYATYVIENGLKDYIFSASSQIVRIPNYFYNKYIKIKEIERTLLIKLGREPENEEIAIELIKDKIASAKTDKDKAKLVLNEVKRIEEIKGVFKPVMSLDVHVSDDEGETNTDKYNLFSSKEEPVDEIVIRETRQEYLRENLYDILRRAGVTEKELDILIARTPNENGKRTTLKIVGEKYNITDERVRQVEEIAKQKVKRRAPYLRDYI